MTRGEKLVAIADVLLTAAAKTRELSDTGPQNGHISRETSLAIQIEGIARDFKTLAAEDLTDLPAAPSPDVALRKRPS